MTTNTVFAALHKHYQNARKRQMGSITAFVFVILQVFAYTFLRLEGPAWQGLWQRYEPWFKGDAPVVAPVYDADEEPF